MTFLCIDIGATNTLLGVGEHDFATIQKHATTDIITDLAAAATTFLDTTPYTKDDLTDLGVAVAGPLDEDRTRFYPSNLGQDVVSLTALDALADTVHCYNDCTAGVIGEHAYGDTDTDNLVYLTISTGIGAGIISNGSLVEGAGSAGEVGHIPVDRNGIGCGCGGTDHWESYCGGQNIPRMAAELYDAAYDTARDLFTAYHAGDETAHRIVERIRRYNVAGIATVNNLFDPDHIAVGGGIGLNHADIVLDGVADGVADSSVNQPPTISQTSLGENTVIHGLRALCTGNVVMQ